MRLTFIVVDVVVAVDEQSCLSHIRAFVHIIYSRDAHGAQRVVAGASMALVAVLRPPVL